MGTLEDSLKVVGPNEKIGRDDIDREISTHLYSSAYGDKGKFLLVDAKEEQAIKNAVTTPLTDYLAQRESQDKDQTWYHVGVSKVTRFGRQLVGMEDASSKFDQALKAGDKTAMMSLRTADDQQRKFEDSATSYSSAMLKTGFLFAGGKVGFAGLVGVTTSDQTRPSDTFNKQLVDAALGAAKGIATQVAFETIRQQAWDPVLKGWTFGMSDRMLDQGLTSSTYENRDGKVDIAHGLQKTLSTVFSPESLLVDGASVGASYALLYPLNSFTKGALFANPLAAKVAMAGVSGLTGGSLKELNYQQDIGRKTDWMDIAKKGGEKSVLDMISALPNPRGF